MATSSLAPTQPSSRLADRRFPAPGWAWPTAARDLLLRAALLPDPNEALAAFTTWLSTHNLDDIAFVDHRLMAAITERHGTRLAAYPEYPRLIGLQRQLWTRSRLSLNATLPALEYLATAGFPLMLLKGAARIALDASAQRQRAQHDIDVLLRPEQVGAAARVLVDAGWVSGVGDSALRAVYRASTLRAINFILPPWGNVDLHRSPYHARQVHSGLDKQLWADAEPAEFFGISVLVPSAAERLAMCMAHGVTSPEGHSDWLVDAAEIIATGTVDWKRASDVFVRRRMVTQAQVALGYLHAGLGVQLPPEALTALSMLEREPVAERLTTLLLARPTHSSRPGFQRLHRQALMQVRYWQPQVRTLRLSVVNSWRTKQGGETTVQLGVSLARTRRETPLGDPYVATVTLQPPRATSAPAATVEFRAQIAFESPPVTRRMVLELNSETAHLARFHVFVPGRTEGVMHTRLRARVSLPPGCRTLTLEAHPRKFLHPNEPPSQVQKLGAIPFRLIKSSLPVQADRTEQP